MKKENTSNHHKISIAVSLVIPVFNNAKTVHEQLQKCQVIMEKLCQKYEILISDDKSTDETIHELEKFKKDKNIHIIQQKENLGIAKNILFLYRYAHYSYILLFSIDGDWDTNDIEQLLLHADKTNADIIIGKRDRKNDTLFRRVASFIYNALPFILFGVRTYDTGSIKIFKKDIFNNVSLTLQSVSFESEFLIKAVKQGANIITIPISYIRKKETHKSSVKFRLIVSSLSDLVKLRLKSI